LLTIITDIWIGTYLLFQLIIRSHEGPDAREKRDGFEGMDEGYTIDHIVESGKLITVFSAPDYPQFQVILFARHDLHFNGLLMW
jgi:serine/threonine-protein phosphatase 5